MILSFARGLPVTAGPVCVGGRVRVFQAFFRRQRGGGSRAWLFTRGGGPSAGASRGGDASPGQREGRLGGLAACAAPTGRGLGGARRAVSAPAALALGFMPNIAAGWRSVESRSRKDDRGEGGYKGAADGCRAWAARRRCNAPELRGFGSRLRGLSLREVSRKAVFRCGSRRRNRRRRAGRLRWRARCRQLPEASARAGEAGRRRLPHPAVKRERARAAAGCRRPWRA